MILRNRHSGMPIFLLEKEKNMYYLKTEYSFDSAHFLAGYEGKCRNIHGHRWRVVVKVKGEELEHSGSQKGMLVDFGDLKKDVKKETERLDHALIVEQGSLRPHVAQILEEEGFRIITVAFRPTAELFAKYFYEIIQNLGYQVRSVTVYETPNNSATYEEDDDDSV